MKTEYRENSNLNRTKLDWGSSRSSSKNSFTKENKENRRVVQVARKSGRRKQRLLNNKDIISLFSQMASMLQSGLSVIDTLDCMSLEGQSKVTKNIVIWKHTVSKGKQLHEAMQTGSISFPPSLLSVIKAGEETGKLADFLGVYIKELKKISEIESKMKSALTYPAIIISIVSIVMVFMFTITVPKLETMFQSANTQPKGIAAIIFKISRVATIIGTERLLVLALLFSAWLISNYGKKFLVNFFSFLPAMRKIKVFSEWGIFTSSISMSLNAGLSLLDTFTLAQSGAPSTWKRSTYDLLLNGIVQGKSLLDIKEVEFPTYAKTHIRTAESSGNLPKAFEFISQYYFEEVTERISVFSQTIEPVLIIFVLGVVSTVPMAIVKTMSDMYIAVMGGK